jgi:cyanophycinase
MLKRRAAGLCRRSVDFKGKQRRNSVAANLARWPALYLAILLFAPPEVGPGRGSLVVVGGGEVTAAIRARFIELAGGKEAEFVVIPTAQERDEVDREAVKARFAKEFGLEHATVLHTRDPKEADREEFVAPLRKAGGVWFTGGRQWRLTDAYLRTRTQRAIEEVLERGGVIGGTSAGATIQGSYLVRGAPEGNQIMMSAGHEEGFAYLRNVAIDQHLLARKRADDLVAVIEAHPKLLGLGIDEATAIVVQGDQFEVIGKSKVGIYDGQDHDGKRYYFLSPGDRFDLKTRRPRSAEASGK